MESLKSTGLKISGLSVERVERATQPVYPYVKPTDPYKDFLGEVSPVDAALMHEVAFLRLGLEDGSYSLMAVSRQVADFAMGISHLLKGGRPATSRRPGTCSTGTHCPLEGRALPCMP